MVCYTNNIEKLSSQLRRDCYVKNANQKNISTQWKDIEYYDISENKKIG